MLFSLRKPPITQAWVTASLDGFSSQSSWNWDNADALLDEFSDLPIREQITEQKFEIIRQPVGSKVGRGKFTPERQSVRSRDEQTTRIIQVEPNRMTVTRCREPGGVWVGSQVLFKDFQIALEAYQKRYPTPAVVQLELHHVDMVEIENPPVKDGFVKLTDLFTGAPDFPVREFGNTIDIGWHATFLDPGETSSYIVFSLEYMPRESARDAAAEFGTSPKPRRREFRFRLDWHAVCSERLEFTLGEDPAVLDRLNKLNSMAKSRFREVCRPIWHEFSPE